MSASALSGLCAATAGIVHQRRSTTSDQSSDSQHTKQGAHSSPRSSGDKASGSGISAGPSGVGKETLGGPAMDMVDYADEVAKKALEIYSDTEWKVARSSVSSPNTIIHN